jgi:hypothetical protein
MTRRILMRKLTAATLGVSGLIASPVVAQDRGAVTPIASLRVRHETWDWFDAGAAGRYGLTGLHARLGAIQDAPRFGWRFELAAPALLGLPSDAVQPGTAGQLGLGGTYFAANDNRRDVAGLWIKQATLRFGREGRDAKSLRVGRFEFSDGGEWAPADPALARVRQQRVAQRLLGPFGFTHGQRSFDGLQVQSSRRSRNVTLAAFRPTSGVFMVDGGRTLDVRVAYAAINVEGRLGGRPSDFRAFAIHYDDRRGTVPVDARPLALRQTASRDVRITTLGAHIIQRYGSPERPVDLLLWGARQFGDWSDLRQSSGAFVAELGWRDLARATQPGLRLGFSRTSGDGNPADGVHGTFHQMLPTPRAFALFPFHNMQNLQEVFAAADLRVTPTLTARASGHHLQLSEARDLWTLGGGAFDDAVFGFPGRPSGDARAMGNAVSLSLAWQPTRQLQLELFASQASGGDVMAATYGAARPARLVYLETTVRR